MKLQRILIAGMTGFLGSQLAHRLIAEGNVSLVGLRRRTSNLFRLHSICSQVELVNFEEGQLDDLFTSRPFDIVVNCIADYGRHRSDQDVLNANLHLPSRLLQLSLDHRVPMFLNAGTSLPPEVNAYANSKHQFSRRLQEASERLIAIDAKLEHFYGAEEDAARFIRFLVEKFLQPAANLELTKGEQKRDFLHVEDVASALCLMMRKAEQWKPGYSAIPVGSGEAYVLRDVVETVRRLTGNRETKIHYGAVPYREQEVMESKADTRRLNALGWQPKWDLEAGLKSMIDSYRDLSKERISA